MATNNFPDYPIWDRLPKDEAWLIIDSEMTMLANDNAIGIVLAVDRSIGDPAEELARCRDIPGPPGMRRRESGDRGT